MLMKNGYETELYEAKKGLYSGLYEGGLEENNLTVKQVDENIEKALCVAWKELRETGLDFENDREIREIANKLHFLKQKEKLLCSMGVNIDFFGLFDLPEIPSSGVLQAICRYNKVGRKLYSLLIEFSKDNLEQVCQQLTELARDFYGKDGKVFYPEKILINSKVSKFKVPTWEYSVILTFLGKNDVCLLEHFGADTLSEYWCIKELYLNRPESEVIRLFCALFKFQDSFIAEKLIRHKIKFERSKNQ